jgi:hypothetical protein
MKCMHPYCPMGDGAANWGDVVDTGALKARLADRSALLGNLSSFRAPTTPSSLLPPPTSNSALLTRLLALCPCLYNQLDIRCSPQGIVHLRELTLTARITSANVVSAFDVQHPGKAPDFRYGPGQKGADAGSIMEALCSEVLDNEGIPAMDLDRNSWPVWRMPGHIMLNAGKMRAVKAFGDILIPAAPSNIIISVKTQAARERLLYSANMIEGVGFGFFDEPSEFWSQSRMNLFKRMGFTAIYLPDSTHTALTAHITSSHLESFAVNINGKELYRSLSRFGADMRTIVGRTTLEL